MSTLEQAITNAATDAPTRHYTGESIFTRFLKFLCSVRLGVTLLVMLGTLCLSRRGLHTICFLCALVGNELVNATLKRYWREARPYDPSVPTAAYGKYGMPSSHSQFTGFFVAYMTLFIAIRQHLTNTTYPRLFKCAQIKIMLVGAAVVCIGRLYLRQHTNAQVAYGVLIGAALGVCTFAIVHVVLTPVFPMIVKWRICELLLIRDTTNIPNILLFEYHVTRNEANARNRKRTSLGGSSAMANKVK